MAVMMVVMARRHRTRRQTVRRMDVVRRGMVRWHRTGNRLVRRGLRHRLRDLDHRRLALGHRTSVVRRCRESRATQRDTGDTGHHHLLNHVVHIPPTFLSMLDLRSFMRRRLLTLSKAISPIESDKEFCLSGGVA